MDLASTYAQLADLTIRVQQLAQDHPNWTVTRNDLRNWVVLDEAGDYVGYIDLISGEIDIDPTEAKL